jgi:hypothetical protein
MTYAKSIAINYLGRIEPDSAPSRFGRFQKRLASSKKTVIFLVCAAALVLFATCPLLAQLSSGGIAGTVKDSTGAVVRGAQITLTNQAIRSPRKRYRL